MTVIGGGVESPATARTPRTPAVTENEARTQLRRMLSTLTAGSVLHLLAELFEADAEAAQRVGDDLTAERCENVSATLAVVGLGIDAACPR